MGLLPGYSRLVRAPAIHQWLEKQTKVTLRDVPVSAVGYRRCNLAWQLGIAGKGVPYLFGNPTFGTGIDRRAGDASIDRAGRTEAMTFLARVGQEFGKCERDEQADVLQHNISASNLDLTLRQT